MLAAVLLLAGPVAAAPSATTILHRGGNDPATEGWTQLTSGTDPGRVEAGRETTASGEHTFWRIQDRIPEGLQAYRQPLLPEATERAWRFSAVLRIVDSPVITFHDGVGGTGVVVADGQHYWSFYLTNTQVGPVGRWAGSSTAYHLARTLPLDTRADYHEYGILFDPVGPGSADDSADFFVDGRLVFDDVPRRELFETPRGFVHFGATSLPGLSDAHYAWVCFEGELPPAEARIPPSAARGCGIAPTATATVTATATDSPTRTATASSTPTPTATASASPSPTSSPTPTASTTATPTPPPPPTAAPCVPAHRASDIALVLDRSSSMNSANKLGAAVAAINQFVDGVQAPPDQLALVTFADVAGLNQPLTSDKAAVRRALSAVVTGNGTRIDVGLQRAREELLGQRRGPDHAPVVILLSDGVQASGEESRVETEAAAARAAGIVVFTIAFGADADIDTLRRIATSPAHAFVAPTNADLATIYRRIAAAIPCPATATLAPVTVAATPTALASAAVTTETPSDPTPTADASRTAARWVIYLPLAGSPVHGRESAMGDAMARGKDGGRGSLGQWSPSGDYLAAGAGFASNAKFELAPFPELSPVRQFNLPWLDHRMWSPDSRRLALSTNSGEAGTVYLLDVAAR